MAPSFTQRMTGHTIKYVAPVLRGNAVGPIADVYAQVEHEFDLVPPITIHSPVPDILAAFWSLMREVYIVGKQGRADREIIAAAVSQTNDCPFCVEIHSAMLHATSQHSLANEMLDPDKAKSSTNPLAQWAMATSAPGAAVLAMPPFSPTEAPQIVGTAILYHYLNRMVNVFIEPSPNPVRLSSMAARNSVGRILGMLFRRRFIGIDASPDLLLPPHTEAALSKEFSWAAPNASINTALARFSSVIEIHGRRVLSQSAREVIAAFLVDWRGEYPSLSLHWLDVATKSLVEPFDQAAARLALLTAIASYRVDQTVVAAFRRHRPSDADLIATAAWASLKATQRIATWIAPDRLHHQAHPNRSQ